MKAPTDLPMLAAVRYLGTADRTEAELRGHLERKGFVGSEVERVVTWAVGKKYVSDVRVAEREVEMAQGTKLVGRAKTKARLLKRGADEAVVDKAVESYSESDEVENALVLLKRKFKASDDPSRIARYLVGRGFEEEAVRKAVCAFIPGLEW